MGGLLALPEVPREIDEIRLTQLLAIWWEEGARTIFREVFRLPPAHCLVAGPEGVRLRRYWRLEDAPQVRLGSDGEYVEAFLDIYGEAVRRGSVPRDPSEPP